MKLIVGLGNPGEKYKNTRHNVGFAVVDKIVTSNKLQVTRGSDSKLFTSYMLPTTKVILAKPQTFMNLSGVAVKEIAAYYKIHPSDIWIIHDDLDIRLGDFKIQKGVGPKLHYGIQSIEEKLESKDFWRVRVGVDDRPANNRIPGEEYVLREFGSEEELRDKVIKEVSDELKKRLF